MKFEIKKSNLKSLRKFNKSQISILTLLTVLYSRLVSSKLSKISN